MGSLDSDKHASDEHSPLDGFRCTCRLRWSFDAATYPCRMLVPSQSEAFEVLANPIYTTMLGHYTRSGVVCRALSYVRTLGRIAIVLALGISAWAHPVRYVAFLATWECMHVCLWMTFDKMRLAALALVWWVHDQAGGTVVLGEQSRQKNLKVRLRCFSLTLKRYP